MSAKTARKNVIEQGIR